MSLRKTATVQEPHATYVAGDWTWKVLKVNAPKKSPRTPGASWFCSVKTPFTFGSSDLGDTYANDVMDSGRLQQSTAEFDAYLGEHNET